MKKYIEFREVPIDPSRKTKVIDVVNISGDYSLGQIRWWGRWRQYVFFPNKGTLYSSGCMDEIVGFIRCLMVDRRLEKYNE